MSQTEATTSATNEGRARPEGAHDRRRTEAAHDQRERRTAKGKVKHG
jgi:hypothetical protein